MLKLSVNTLDDQFTAIEQTQESIKVKIQELKTANVKLKNQINDLQQFIGKSNIIIQSVVEEKEDSVPEIVSELEINSKCHLEIMNIVSIYRIPSRKGIPPTMKQIA